MQLLLCPGAVAFKNAYFGAGSGNIWLDNVYCAGTEANIFSCPRAAGVGVHNCDHSEDVGIRCPRMCQSFVYDTESIYYLIIVYYV